MDWRLTSRDKPDTSYDAVLGQKVTQVWFDCQQIHPGMTRADLDKMYGGKRAGSLCQIRCRCHNGKRTGPAAIRIAVEMVGEGLISKEEAILRVEPQQLDQLLHPVLDPASKKTLTLLAIGLPASPGAAVGQITRELPAGEDESIPAATASSGELTSLGLRSSSQEADAKSTTMKNGEEPRELRCSGPRPETWPSPKRRACTFPGARYMYNML